MRCKKRSGIRASRGLAGLPDVVKQLVDNIKWTDELGNAFLAQQSDVMDAVQRLRGKAKTSGKLTSNEQIKVETKVVESKTVVVVSKQIPGCLRTELRPRRCLGRAGVLSVSLSVLSAGRLLRGRYGDFVWCRSRDGRDVGWRMGATAGGWGRQQYN